MFHVTLIFVISTCVYFTTSNGVVQNFDDFSMLGCSEFRNVTFITFHYHYFGGFDRTLDDSFFLQEFNDLLDNEACFMVNYFDGFDIVRLRKNYNINQFQLRTNSFRLEYSRYKNEWRRIAELIKQLYDDKIMGDNKNIKQTIVLMGDDVRFADEILVYLELLQEERQWAVIIYRTYSQYKPIDWLPLNRNIETQIMTGITMQHQVIKTLFDVIKNPDFDVYNMTYRWVMSKRNFFTDDCMKEIRKIFITVLYMKFTYVPMASAILRKVNDHRSKVNQEPLEIHFSSYWKGMKLSSDGHLSKTEFNSENHPLNEEKNKRYVYILILNGEESMHCPKFWEKQDLYYRQFL
eukprot:TCONS_00002034-protein